MNKPQTILITGATKGIGLETARQLGELGHTIIISGRNHENLQKAKHDLTQEDISVDTLVMDVGDPQSIHIAAEKWKAQARPIHVLINNAAVLLKTDTSLAQSADEIFEETIRTNGHGPLWVVKSFLPLMHTPGQIIMLSSSGGSMSDPVGGWSPAYCVSKTMVNALTRHLAYELHAKHISVNAVCPGWVRTSMGGQGAPRSVEKGAETVVWLASAAEKLPTGKFFRDKKEIPW